MGYRKLITSFLAKCSKKLSRKGLYEFLESCYCQIPKGAKVLTVGSGGEINYLLSKHSDAKPFDVLSIDIDDARNPDVVGDISSYSFGDEKFDFIIISEVLEHVKEPQLAVDNLHKHLEPNGVLVLSTPFIMPLHDRPYDFYRYTKYGLGYLLRGFEDVEIKERNSYFEAIDVLWVRIMMVGSRKSLLLSILIVPLVMVFKVPLSFLLTRWLPCDYMTTGYVATATKSDQT